MPDGAHGADESRTVTGEGGEVVGKAGGKDGGVQLTELQIEEPRPLPMHMEGARPPSLPLCLAVLAAVEGAAPAFSFPMPLPLWSESPLTAGDVEGRAKAARTPSRGPNPGRFSSWELRVIT